MRSILPGEQLPSEMLRFIARQIGAEPTALADYAQHDEKFAPYCTGDGRPVWREASKPPLETEPLVEKGVERLLDIARRLAIGEPVKWWALPT